MKPVLNTNTADQKKLMLLEAFLGGASGQVERQEAEGQKSFLASDTLPFDFNGRMLTREEQAGIEARHPNAFLRAFVAPDVTPDQTKALHEERMAAYRVYRREEQAANSLKADAILTELGFELGPQVEGDEMWRYAKLPDEWSRKGTDHSMWSEICDGQGRVRLGIFYKAAFYDRSCHYSFHPLVYLNTMHGYDRETGNPGAVVVMAGDQVLKNFGQRSSDERSPDKDLREAAYDHVSLLENRARNWLADRFPQRDNPLAYWGESFEALQQMAGIAEAAS